MPTITINMSEYLQEQLAEAVAGIKLTVEDFILLAIADKLDRPTSLDALDPDDAARYANYLRSGESVPLDEAFAYFEARLAGKSIPKPAFRKIKD